MRMRYLVKPMALKTPISFFCSYKLELIDAESEKKDKNMVMLIKVRKTLSKIVVIRSVEFFYSLVIEILQS